jgi:hypothetical protein
MTFSNPALHIDRISVVGEEAEFVKMFDPQPVGAAPVLPERLLPTDPVPEVLAALGFGAVAIPHTRSFDLLNGLTLRTWDNLKNIDFMTIRDKQTGTGSQWPAGTIRVPRGVVFHGETGGKGPPPHTIHWHGIEPTPINDGVGHCSMEIGGYVYQWQPNFIGSYFYHCHRNTMQHFEFGLYGNLFILPPDAYFASVQGADWRTRTLPPAPLILNNIPVGAGEDGLFRTAANLLTLDPAVQAKFPGFTGGDPNWGVVSANTGPVTDPHTFTVPYDVEVMWVFDDRDSVWSDLASDAFSTFPEHGATPGVDDNFHANVAVNDFFAFNDFNADYWFVTGVGVPAPRGGEAQIPTNLIIPPELNSGVSGTRVDVSARVGQTILIRALDAAYNSVKVTFPVDVVIIAWDGRALGVPPFGLYNEAYVVPAGTATPMSTARRFDALIKAENPINDFVEVEFLDTRGGDLLMTARIPFIITA